MSRIRSRGNKDTELALAKLLRANGITGWRRHLQVRIDECGVQKSTSPPISQQKSGGSPCPSPGCATLSRSRGRGTRGERVRVRPDFVFPKSRLAVFVDGCFWHSCPKHATKPKNNSAFWRKKLASNRARDRLVNRTLRRHGWRVLRIWEHELAKEVKGQNAEGRSGRVVRRIQNALDANCAN